MYQGLYVKRVYACGGTGTSGMTSVVKGIKITYSDGSTDQQGHFFGSMASCKTLDIDVEGGERVTEIEMRGPGDGQWLARLRIKTNKGNELFVSKNYCGYFSCNYAKKYEMKGAELGEGIILGMSGQQEKGDTGNQPHIRCLTFRLLQKVTSTELTDVQITNLPQIRLKNVADVSKDNPTETDQVVACSGPVYEKSHSDSTSWSFTDQHLAGVGVSVKYSSPQILAASHGQITGEVKGEYQYTRTDTTTETKTDEVTEKMQMCFAVPKLSRYQYKIEYFYAKGDADFTGTMNVHTQGGVWSYGTKGKYEMVSTSHLRETATKTHKYVNHEWVPCSGRTCS